MTERFTGYGMPSVDFGFINQAVNTYDQSRKGAVRDRVLSDLGKGSLDYGKASQAVMAVDPELGIKLAHMGDVRRREDKSDKEQADFTRSIGRLIGGGSDAGEPSPTPAPRAEVPMPQTPVAAAPGSPNTRVASAFGDVQTAIDNGTIDPQGANGRMPQIAQVQPPQARMQPPIGPGPQPAPRNNPIQNNIPALVAIMSHPGAGKGQQEMAKTLLQEAIKQPEVIKEYDFYQRQTRANGGQPLPLLDYVTQKASAGTQGRAQTAFDVAADQSAAKRLEKDVEAGDAATKRMTDINNMREISRRVGSQGATANIKEALGPYAEALGIDVANLSDIQAYSAIIQRMAPNMRATGSGSTSDIEFKGMLKSLPTLMQNPQAREVTLDTMQALAQYDQARSDIASRVFSKEITHAQAEKERRALPDPMAAFTEWRKANPGAMRGQPSATGTSGPVRVQSPADRDKLAPGTPYIAPDGSQRIKQ